MNAVGRALWNPIVAKEYRSRMRTWRSPLTITLHVLILGVVGWAVFSVIASNVTTTGNGLGFSPASMGIVIFAFLVLFQVALLAFITPALTAGAISGERERQTIDLLFVTPLAPFSIIWGKLLASMSFVVLLILLSVPIFSLVFLFGGIELDQVVIAFALTAVTAMTLGFIGVAFSTIFRRTLAATVASYGAAFVLLVGSPGFGLVFPTEYSALSQVTPAPPAVTLLSPFVPLMVVAYNSPLPGYGVRAKGPYLSNGKGGYCVSTPTGGYCTSVGTGPTCLGCPNVSSLGPRSSGTTLPTGIFAGWQYWQANILMQLVISACALAISALLLPPIRRRTWVGRRTVEPATAPA